MNESASYTILSPFGGGVQAEVHPVLSGITDDLETADVRIEMEETVRASATAWRLAFADSVPRLLFTGCYERGLDFHPNCDIAPDGQRYVRIQASGQAARQ